MPYMGGLSRAQGDPGFFSGIGKILGGVAKVARFVPGPIGGIAGIIAGAGGGQQAPRQTGGVRIGLPIPGTPPILQAGTFQQARPGRAVATVDEAGRICPMKRRRRIDPLNLKALRRANTRQKSFLRAVDRTLKTMPTKASVTSRRRKISGVRRRQ